MNQSTEDEYAAVNMRIALEKLLNMYFDMVNSGDCGNWNPEEDDEVIEARAALKGDSDDIT